MNEHDVIVRCLNCGTEFTPMQPLEVGGTGNLCGFPCPVCQFQGTPSKQEQASLSLPVGDFESQLSTFLTDARAHGIPPEEIMRVLHDELEFTMDLVHPARRMMLNIIDLGEQEGSADTLPMRDVRELQNGRSL